VAKAITSTLTNSINSDRNKNYNLSCHSDDSKKNKKENNNRSAHFTFILTYTRSSNENHTQMHGKLNSLTFPHNIRTITYGMLRAGVGNYLLQQSHTLDFKENETLGN
jgi:hypothetical protein